MTAEPRRPGVVAALPTAPGVYRFRDSGGGVLYTGRAVNLRRRVSSYWGDLRDRGHLAAMVAAIARVEAVSCDSDHEAAWLERNLLEHHLPRWNRATGGQEKPVLVRLRGGAVSPGLHVAFRVEPGEGIQHFGPYLGGGRTRLAVSALRRVLPLAYTRHRLEGAERELARRYGVRSADRDAIAETVASVLRREPAAVDEVRAELVRRRDEASRRLTFELAARLRDELAAFDWVTGEQKVTSLAAFGGLDGALGRGANGWGANGWGGDGQAEGDPEVHGWADGTLVRFEIRSGKLRDWSWRTCGKAEARPLLEATPPKWQAFAQRNARLTARLVGEVHDVREPARGTGPARSPEEVKERACRTRPRTRP